MVDRSCRPHRMPGQTPRPVVRKIVHLRWKQRLGPVGIAARVGLAPSTVHAVLRRCGISRLNQVDRMTGEPVRRYEHPHPGSLIHVDVKKLGNIPDSGGWRFMGRAGPASATGPRRPDRPRATPPQAAAWAPPIVHTVLDDHSRVAYAEIHDDETAAHRDRRCCAARWPGSPPAAWSSSGCCPTTAPAYRSHAWRDACAELGITPKRTRPYRPQTNGKIERFHRTMTAGWAFRRLYTQRTTTPQGPARLAARVQPSPAPHRHRTGNPRSPA